MTEMTMMKTQPSEVARLSKSLAKMHVTENIYLDPMYKTPSKEKNEGRQLAEEK